MIIRSGVDENTVIHLWRELVNAGYDFMTENRQSVRVKYAGRTSDTSGADLRDVVLEFDGRTVTGNVEFHVAVGDWRAHGHDRDQAYNDVILHVVMWQQSGEITYLENGGVVPTVAVGRFYDDIKQCGLEIIPHQILPCYQQAEKTPDQIMSVLNEMGLERFLEKAASFERDLLQFAAGEVLYRGLMEALGYSQNKIPFKKLAGAVSLSELQDVVANNNIDLLALLYGNAGLLPTQRPEIESVFQNSYLRTLENEWSRWRRPPVLHLEEWTFFRVRAGNFPTRRMAGMAALLKKYSKPELLHGLERLVKNALTENSSRILLDGLMCPAEGYWQDHFDFGKECHGLTPWLIGETRAAEIVTNVLLPYYYTYGRGQGDSQLVKKNLALYSVLPQTEENAVEKHMRMQLGLKRSNLKSTRSQQGILHLYHKFCVQGKCQSCPLGG